VPAGLLTEITDQLGGLALEGLQEPGDTVAGTRQIGRTGQEERTAVTELLQVRTDQPATGQVVGGRGKGRSEPGDVLSHQSYRETAQQGLQPLR